VPPELNPLLSWKLNNKNQVDFISYFVVPVNA
jgi:hypothetical protein